jgi:hypothetical protein
MRECERGLGQEGAQKAQTRNDQDCGQETQQGRSGDHGGALAPLARRGHEVRRMVCEEEELAELLLEEL